MGESGSSEHFKQRSGWDIKANDSNPLFDPWDLRDAEPMFGCFTLWTPQLVACPQDGRKFFKLVSSGEFQRLLIQCLTDRNHQLPVPVYGKLQLLGNNCFALCVHTPFGQEWWSSPPNHSLWALITEKKPWETAWLTLGFGLNEVHGIPSVDNRLPVFNQVEHLQGTLGGPLQEPVVQTYYRRVVCQHNNARTEPTNEFRHCRR